LPVVGCEPVALIGDCTNSTHCCRPHYALGIGYRFAGSGGNLRGLSPATGLILPLHRMASLTHDLE
jgi:hypothetical protein